MLICGILEPGTFSCAWYLSSFGAKWSLVHNCLGIMTYFVDFVANMYESRGLGEGAAHTTEEQMQRSRTTKGTLIILLCTSAVGSTSSIFFVFCCLNPLVRQRLICADFQRFNRRVIYMAHAIAACPSMLELKTATLAIVSCLQLDLSDVHATCRILELELLHARKCKIRTVNLSHVHGVYVCARSILQLKQTLPCFLPFFLIVVLLFSFLPSFFPPILPLFLCLTVDVVMFNDILIPIRAHRRCLGRDLRMLQTSTNNPGTGSAGPSLLWTF